MITPDIDVYVRNSDPETSLEAALRAVGNKQKAIVSRKAVYAALQARYPRPLSDPQIALWVAGSAYAGKFSPSRLRHARLELERAGLVERCTDRIEHDGARYTAYKLVEETPQLAVS